MYTENPVRDVLLFGKAVLSNQIARFSPALYVRLTNETGRGKEDEDPADVAAYFIRCFDEYCQPLGWTAEQFNAFLRGKRVLEYGPGDSLGVALLMYAHGAEHVDCVDRFPLQRVSIRNVQIYSRILASLKGSALERGKSAFVIPGDPSSGFKPEAVDYIVTKDGLAGRHGGYDLVISRAVLEHVNSLEKTIADVADALAPTGISIHEVDLRSHGLDRYKPLDFLTWPDFAYRLMFSRKGFPNRWRIDAYKKLVASNSLQMVHLSPTTVLQGQQVEVIKNKVAARFRTLTSDELSWLGFWMVLKHTKSE